MFSGRCSIWPLLEFSLLGLVHLWLQLVFSLARGDLGSAVLSREWWRGLKVGHLRPPPPLSRELAAQSSMGEVHHTYFWSTTHTSGPPYILWVYNTRTSGPPYRYSYSPHTLAPPAPPLVGLKTEIQQVAQISESKVTLKHHQVGSVSVIEQWLIQKGFEERKSPPTLFSLNFSKPCSSENQWI